MATATATKTAKKEALIRLVDATLLKQSEKAYHVTVDIDTAAGRRGWNLWLPKTTKAGKALTTVEDGKIIVTEWLYNIKCDEINEHYRNGGFYGITGEPAN